MKTTTTKVRLLLFSAVASSALFFSRTPVRAGEYSCCGNKAGAGGSTECEVLLATAACPGGGKQCEGVKDFTVCCTNACFDD